MHALVIGAALFGCGALMVFFAPDGVMPGMLFAAVGVLVFVAYIAGRTG